MTLPAGLALLAGLLRAELGADAVSVPPAQAPKWRPKALVQPDYGPCDPAEFANKEFDVMIFGLGHMTHAIQPLTRAVGDEMVKVAYVTHQNVEQLKYQLALAMGPDALKYPTTFEADMKKNPEKLDELAKQARVVLNLAGPYEEHGAENLIRASVGGCANYVDLSTETKWQRAMYEEFNAAASLRHVAIVQAAGFDSVASDLLAMSAANDVVRSGSPAPTHVMLVWRLINEVRPTSEKLSQKYALTHHGSVKDPYILSPEVPLNLRVDKTVGGGGGDAAQLFQPIVVQVTVPYIQASHDCPVIRRSMHLQYPNSAVSVHEVCDANLLPSLGAFRRNRTDPATGQEPPPEDLAAGSFMGEAYALYRPGNVTEGEVPVQWTKVTMEGVGDAHHVLTPRIAWQIVLGLVFDGPKRYGYLTPTTALGTEILEKRLVNLDKQQRIRMFHSVDGHSVDGFSS